MFVQIFASSASTAEVWRISAPKTSNSSAAFEPEPAAAQDALEQFLRAGLLERHPAGRDGLEPRVVLVDADDVDAGVGEGQREWKPDPAEPHDRGALCHGRRLAAPLAAKLARERQE